MLIARLTPAPFACPTKMQLPAMPSPRPSPAPSRSPPRHAPVAGSRSDGHQRHPVQVLEVAKQEESLLEREGAGLRVCLRRDRIDVALPVDAHRRHLRHRRVEGARLAAGGILGMVDALLVGSKDGPAAFDFAQARKPGDYEQTSRGKHAQGYTREGAFHARQSRAGAISDGAAFKLAREAKRLVLTI